MIRYTVDFRNCYKKVVWILVSESYISAIHVLIQQEQRLYSIQILLKGIITVVFRRYLVKPNPGAFYCEKSKVCSCRDQGN